MVLNYIENALTELCEGVFLCLIRLTEKLIYDTIFLKYTVTVYFENHLKSGEV